MSLVAIIINVAALTCLVIAFIRDRTRAKQSLAIAARSFIRILPATLAIVILVGLLLGFVPPTLISRIVGQKAGFTGIIIPVVVGAVLYVPSIIAFPLAGSLIKEGASVAAVAAFITTLTMVGIVTLPLEIRVLGKRFALLRNGISLLLAIIIALLMELIL
jgi:uncharacterized membrane protein YraQ (UPF0718 family)